MKYILLISALMISISLPAQRIPESPTPTETEFVVTPTEEKSKLFSGKPGKAALYSLVLPGAGQIYNRKYWKLPLVYGAVGGSIGLLAHNGKQFKLFGGVYEASIAGTYTGPRSTENLRQLRNEARKNQQISGVVLGVAWLLNSVDAYVDAHLSTFDSSDDLSNRLIPVSGTVENSIASIGIQYRF